MRLHDPTTLAVIVRSCGGEDRDDRGSTEKVVVRELIKQADGSKIKIGNLLRIPFVSDYRGGEFALVFAAYDDSRQLGITEIQWISQSEANYFSGLSKLTDKRSRVRFLLEAEASGDARVSDHAFAELKAIQAEQLRGLLQKDQRDFVLRRLRTPGLASARRSLYLLLLGFVGESTDIKYLEPYVFPEKEVSTFIEPATAAYLRLGDERARRKLVERYFDKPPVPARTDSENLAQAQRLYPIYKAIRDVAPELERQAKVGEYLLMHSALGDMVLASAFGESDARFVDSAIQSYWREDAIQYSREESVVYLAGMLDCDLPADRRERINHFLESVQATEPELFRRSIERLAVRRKFMTSSDLRNGTIGGYNDADRVGDR
jgi:hypothetical protein